MAKDLSMLSVQPTSNAAPTPPSPALKTAALPREAFRPSNSPGFSQVFATSKSETPQRTFKHETRSWKQDHESQNASETAKTPPSAKNSALGMAPPPLSVATPVVIPALLSGPVKSGAEPGDGSATVLSAGAVASQAVVGAQNATHRATPSLASGAIAQQQDAGACVAMLGAMPERAPSAGEAIAELERKFSCRFVDAVGDANSPVEDQGGPIAADPCNADSSQATNATTTLASLPTRPKPDAASSSDSTTPLNDPAHLTQSGTTPAPNGAQPDASLLSLPDSVTLISGAAEGNQTSSTKMAVQNRESIAQQIRPTLPAVPSAIPASAALNKPTVMPNCDAGAGNSFRDSPSQSGSQSAAQAHSSESSHSREDPKFSNSPGSQQPSAAQNGQAASPQNTSGANTNSPASTAALGIQSAHIAAPAAAQVNTSGDSSRASNPSTSTTSPDNQPSSLASAAAANVPSSLSDLNRAPQLYQRVDGAEMHISMDTGALGSIDLRAVVHQGSLSATIGVQRADVQMLLVNELPGLQHSLAQKNFQVNQISVLAGSVGSGANPYGQPRERQNRQGAAPTPAPPFHDASPTLVSGVHASCIVASSVGWSKLSVIA